MIKLRDERGIAMITAILLTLVMATISIAAIKLSEGAINHSALDRKRDEAIQAAQGAVNAYTAQVMIDFCYDPKIAAQIEAYVNYICPVKGAADVLLAADPDTAKNPLIFPPADILAKLHIFNGLDEATEKYFNDQFATVTGLG